MPNGKPNARKTIKFATATENQSRTDQPIVIARPRGLESTPKAVASCSSVLRIASLIRRARRDCAFILTSSQLITVFDCRRNQIRKTTATITILTSRIPILLVRAICSAVPPTGVNQRRFKAKNRKTEAVSYNRSTRIVTNEAAGRTRRSRMVSTAGRTTSPARPSVSTAPNPTVVAIQTSRTVVFASGASNARHLSARHR